MRRMPRVVQIENEKLKLCMSIGFSAQNGHIDLTFGVDQRLGPCSNRMPSAFESGGEAI